MAGQPIRNRPEEEEGGAPAALLHSSCVGYLPAAFSTARTRAGVIGAS